MKEAEVSHQKTSAEIRRRNLRRFYTMVLIFAFCTLLYYFGDLIDFLGWKSLRWDFFYGVHDIHRLLFLAPIIYAGYFFGSKPAIIVTVIALNVFLPRALFISPFPDPLFRVILFVVIAGVIGYITGWESERRKRLNMLVKKQSDAILAIMERTEDGVMIIGPDYRIRSLNPTMEKDFGKGIGNHCYQYLHQLDRPCDQICRLTSVLKGKAEKLECDLPNGNAYEVSASPYVDVDGKVCLLAVLTRTKQSQRNDL